MRPIFTFIFLVLMNPAFSQGAKEKYDKAYSQLKSGVNAAEVLQTLQSCIDLDEKYEDAYILRAFILYKLEDYAAAIKDYDALLAINPKHEEALKKRAITKVRIKNFEGAIIDHNLRIKYNSKNAVAYFDRAYCKGLLGFNEAAIEDYTRAIQLDDELASAYSNRGIAKLNKFISNNNNRHPNIEEAEFICEDFQKARKLGDTSVSQYLNKYCTLH